MYMDVLHLRDWYAGHQGWVAKRTLLPYFRDFLKDAKGLRVLVLGYGLPFMESWHKQDAGLLTCAMPARMGVLHWPSDKPNKTVMVWEEELPFVDNQFDRVVVAHGLEFCENAEQMVAECWRVLRPDGQLLVMAPNRTGPWCRMEGTPFGRGQPYSATQLGKLLRQENFMVLGNDYALFVPPTERQWVLGFARTLEELGHRWWPLLGGVVLTVARKDVLAGRAVRVQEKLRRRKPALEPAGLIPGN